jgi:hypothetical protein
VVGNIVYTSKTGIPTTVSNISASGKVLVLTSQAKRDGVGVGVGGMIQVFWVTRLSKGAWETYWGASCPRTVHLHCIQVPSLNPVTL